MSNTWLLTSNPKRLVTPNAKRDCEITKAIQAANKALRHLEAAQHHLDEASDWGRANMLAGSMCFSLSKHNQLDFAWHEIGEAERALDDFTDNLLTVGNIYVDVSPFLYFKDVWDNDFMAGCLVQSKIDMARHQVLEAVSEVTRARDRLCRM